MRNSRRERHCPAGALGHPIDHATSDAVRCLLRHGAAGGGGLRFEIRHGTREDLGDCGKGLGPEDGGKGCEGIRGRFKHGLKAVAEHLRGGHGLLRGGRTLHGGQHDRV